MDAEGQVIFFLRRTYPSQYKPRRFWNADFPPYISLFEYKGPSKRKPLKKGLWKISSGDYFRNLTVFIHSTPFRSRICGGTWSNFVLPTSLSITECSRRKIKKCEQKKQTTSRGWGRGWEPQLLSTSFPHYFFLDLSSRRTPLSERVEQATDKSSSISLYVFKHHTETRIL